MFDLKTTITAAFGLLVIASGMLRYFGAEGGETGLWFGIAMGTIPLIATVCFYWKRIWLAQSLSWFAILVVGGWFIYEALIKKGIAESETRQLVVIAASMITAVILAAPRKQSLDQSSHPDTQKKQN